MGPQNWSQLLINISKIISFQFYSSAQPSKDSCSSSRPKETKYKLLYVSKRRGLDSSSVSMDLSVKCVTTKSCPTQFQNDLQGPTNNLDNVQFYEKEVVKYSSGRSKSLKRFSSGGSRITRTSCIL